MSVRGLVELSVIGCVDMFNVNGITPLATAGQTNIKIRVGKYIDAAQHERESPKDPQKQKMIVAGDSGGQPERNMLGSTIPYEDC